MQNVFRVLSHWFVGLGGVLVVLAFLQIDRPVRGDTTSNTTYICLRQNGNCVNANCPVPCPTPPAFCSCPGNGGGGN